MTVLSLLLLCVVVLLGVVIWSIKRHRDPHLRVDTDAPLDKLTASLSGLTHGLAVKGNAVEILENGAFFDVLLENIRTAERTVHFETFLWKEGMLGARVAEALAERARAGVQVRVLVDARGGRKMGRAARQRMVQAGCRLALYHPFNLRNLGVYNERDHRKLTVLDGRVAFIGGHCITDGWLGNAQDDKHVRDISVRVRGPVVHAMQAAFAENWVEVTGELFVGEDVFPALDSAGDVEVHVACVKPEGSAPAVKILHHLAICCARKQILIQNPYFIPDADAIKAFGEAVARGVEVRIMVPSADASDMPLVQHAAHRNFDKLLAAGVRLFEYRRTLLHQKVMTVDGVWCIIGSSNFDPRSFETNDEIALGFQDAGLAKRLEEIFEIDCRDCIELEPRAWAQRGLWHRLKDNTIYLVNEVL